jgi:hypothetical protein
MALTELGEVGECFLGMCRHRPQRGRGLLELAELHVLCLQTEPPEPANRRALMQSGVLVTVLSPAAIGGARSADQLAFALPARWTAR